MKLRSGRGILALLTALNFLNYLDRFVLVAVLERVERDLHLNDTMAGALGTVFLVGYFLTSPIFARLADRRTRKGLIAFGIAVWSLATIGTGLTHGVGLLFVMRALVGVGEASFATLAPTIIDDLAPPDRKSRWLAIFYVATPVGSALGYLVGGAVESRYGWRAAFFVAGGPGLVLALSCLLIEEPKRKMVAAVESLLDSIKALMRFPAYVRGVLGYSAYTFAVAGFGYWAPVFIFRVFKMDLGRANFLFGAITVAGGVVGTAIGGWVSDHMAARAGGSDRGVVRAGLVISAVGSVIAIPVATFCFLSPSPTPFFIAVFFCEVALFVNTSPINAVILRSVPEERRAAAMALSITAIHLLGDLWSPLLIGAIADHTHNIRLAMMILPVAMAGSVLLWIPRRADRVDGAAA